MSPMATLADLADLGTIQVEQTGKTTLSVKAVAMPNGAVMNLRAVRLTPAG